MPWPWIFSKIWFDDYFSNILIYAAIPLLDAHPILLAASSSDLSHINTLNRNSLDTVGLEVAPQKSASTQVAFQQVSLLLFPPKQCEPWLRDVKSLLLLHQEASKRIHRVSQLKYKLRDLPVQWDHHMGVSKNRGTQKWMFIMENPIKMDDVGVPLFLETPISENLGWC